MTTPPPTPPNGFCSTETEQCIYLRDNIFCGRYACGQNVTAWEDCPMRSVRKMEKK